MVSAWSSLLEDVVGSYRPNCQTKLVKALHELSLVFCIVISTMAYTTLANTSLHLPLLKTSMVSALD